ncbi:MAG: hypothetical protein Q8O95_04110 [bacterium]|nr:hypothetical protein [bacterium]
MAHTTISVDKSIFTRTAKRAKQQHLSVSAIARMLLDAYASGRINVIAIQTEEPIELRELSKSEITPEMRKKADRVYKMNRSQLINIRA